MFGFIGTRPSSLSEDEQTRYRAVYCGLCRALKERYGQISRMALNYDLTFYILLCDSLHEPPERAGEGHCIAHPRKPMPYAMSRYTDYAADVTVVLAYHKCLDDWKDDRKRSAHAASKLLAGAYRQARQRIPEICEEAEASMERTRRLELSPDTPPDAVSQEFGHLFGRIFGYDQGIWTESMELFGAQLGRFVYLMDAAVDFEEDQQSGSYNPFVQLNMDTQTMKTLLAVAIGDAARTFERLPLEYDLHLLRSVLYSGVWQQFNKKYGIEGDGEYDVSLTQEVR